MYKNFKNQNFINKWIIEELINMGNFIIEHD